MFAREEQEDFQHLGKLMVADGKSWRQRERCAPAAGVQMGSGEASTETAQEEFNTSSSVRMIVWICKEEPVF